MNKKIHNNKIFSILLIILLFFSSIGFVSTAKTVDEFDFIIITPSDLSEDLLLLLTHKENLGISTKIITLDEIYNSFYFPVNGRDAPEKIKYFIKNAKESWSVQYVLLVGGKDKMPVRIARIYAGHGNYTYYIVIYILQISTFQTTHFVAGIQIMIIYLPIKANLVMLMM